MICLLHGYLLEGSGSNLWTRSIIDALCRQGVPVHLVAQENHPDRYPFIAHALSYAPDGAVLEWYESDVSYPAGCVLHKPLLGDTLPVYVWDRYEEFAHPVPMVDLDDAQLRDYLDRNTAALLRVVREQGITAMHANHSVLMSVVAQRVSEATGIPFAIMPHGSALEFAVKRDVRFHRLAESAFAAASRIFVIGDEMRQRVRTVLPEVPGLEQKFVDLHLGVDTSRFEPVARTARAERVARLGSVLAGVPRGRTAAQEEDLRVQLRTERSESELADLLAAARAYDNKAPDAHVEEKLARVDWARDPVLLFVGRMIASKGVQSVLTALPFLLAAEPRLRLVLVGHGPLREVLEAMLWAMEQGNVALLRLIAARGRVLEGSPEGESEGVSLPQLSAYMDALEREGRLDAWIEEGRTHVRRENVIFTGYLNHTQLHHVFPCCDVAVFPSVVREAGPLVFLEALGSGVFPLGTYFGGMAASIDSAATVVPGEVAEVMKLRAEPEHTAADIVRHVPLALAQGDRWSRALYDLARERYDWKSVARTLKRELEEM